MCGRFDLTAPVEELLAEYGGVPAVEPLHSYNIYPSQQILAIRTMPSVGNEWCLLKWGLVPHWSKTPTVDYDTKNAVGETLTSKPSFRDAFKSHRCLIPASGFFEWNKETGQPYRITSANGGLLTFAGLYSTWRRGGQVVDSCTIVTTKPNGVMQPIHHRMPVILSKGDFATWLDPSNSDTASLQNLIQPCNDDQLQAYRVSKVVNSPKHDRPDCIAPID